LFAEATMKSSREKEARLPSGRTSCFGIVQATRRPFAIAALIQRFP
jgi:hypothetical protein